MSLQALFPSLPDTVPSSGGGTTSTSADFEVLALSLGATDLTEAVAELSNFTLFAPTDQAFANLATQLGFEGDTDDAEAVFASISTALDALDETGDGRELLAQILQYHIIPTTAADLADLNAEGSIATLLGDTGRVTITDGVVEDLDPDAANATIISADVDTTSGTIQIVDGVLLPFDTPIAETDEEPDTPEDDPTLFEFLSISGGTPDEDGDDFDLLLTALAATGLDVVVDDETNDLTVFAPTDDAFILLAQSLGYEGDDEEGALRTLLDASADANPEEPLALLTDVLSYHVSPGAQSLEEISESGTVETLQGADITVNDGALVDQDPNNADATVLSPDVSAENGTAHVIDQVLLPIDLPPEETEEEETDDEDSSDVGEAFFLLGLVGVFLFAFYGVG